MCKNSLRTGELFEALPEPEKAFSTLNSANKKNIQQQKLKELIEIEMGDVDNNNGNDRNN